MSYYAVEWHRSRYGYSASLAEANAALARGQRVGVHSAKVVELKSPVRGLRAGEWLTPFDDRGSFKRPPRARQERSSR